MKLSSMFSLATNASVFFATTYTGVAAADITTNSMTSQSMFLRRRRLQTVTTSQLKAANTANNCWIQIGDSAYDVTTYASVHPGGADKITSQCGKDVTQGFNNQPAHATGASLLTMPGIVKKGVVTAAPAPTAAPVPAPTPAPVPAASAAPVPAATTSPASNTGTTSTSGMTITATTASSGGVVTSGKKKGKGKKKKKKKGGKSKNGGRKCKKCN